MSRKVIDYVVVEVIKPNHHENLDYSHTYKGEGLNITLNTTNIEDEILRQENNKKLLEEEIKYIDNLLNTVEDFSIYKVTGDEILFYNEKYKNPHPLECLSFLCKEDEEHRIELLKIVKKYQGEIEAVTKKIASLKSELKKLKIKERAILENNQNLDFGTFRTDFEKSVLYYLEKGYELQGGVSISKREYEFIYVQAMVKYEK